MTVKREESSRRGLPELVGHLLSEPPGTRAAEERRYPIESLLMAALKSGGRSAGEEAVESLAANGYALERIDALPFMWRVMIEPPRVLEVWFTPGDDPVVAAVSYRVGKPWGSKAQKTAAKLQAEFYRRYEALDPSARALKGDDRLILLVGELEADVNNGGFGQYLDNKGRARARKALACLDKIGARRTARWLASALEDEDPARLQRLDGEFYAKGEDLASLAMMHFRREEKARRGKTSR